MTPQSRQSALLGFSATLACLLIIHLSLFLGQFLGNWVLILWSGLLASLMSATIWGFRIPRYRSYAIGSLIAWGLILIPTLFFYGTILLTGNLM